MMSFIIKFTDSPSYDYLCLSFLICGMLIMQFINIKKVIVHDDVYFYVKKTTEKNPFYI